MSKGFEGGDKTVDRRGAIKSTGVAILACLAGCSSDGEHGPPPNHAEDWGEEDDEEDEIREYEIEPETLTYKLDIDQDDVFNYSKEQIAEEYSEEPTFKLFYEFDDEEDQITINATELDEIEIENERGETWNPEEGLIPEYFIETGENIYLTKATYKDEEAGVKAKLQEDEKIQIPVEKEIPELEPIEHEPPKRNTANMSALLEGHLETEEETKHVTNYESPWGFNTITVNLEKKDEKRTGEAMEWLENNDPETARPHERPHGIDFYADTMERFEEKNHEEKLLELFEEDMPEDERIVETVRMNGELVRNAIGGISHLQDNQAPIEEDLIETYTPYKARVGGYTNPGGDHGNNHGTKIAHIEIDSEKYEDFLEEHEIDRDLGEIRRLDGHQMFLHHETYTPEVIPLDEIGEHPMNLERSGTQGVFNDFERGNMTEHGLNDSPKSVNLTGMILVTTNGHRLDQEDRISGRDYIPHDDYGMTKVEMMNNQEDWIETHGPTLVKLEYIRQSGNEGIIIGEPGDGDLIINNDKQLRYTMRHNVEIDVDEVLEETGIKEHVNLPYSSS